MATNTMATSPKANDVNNLQKTWIAFDRLAHLRPIRDEQEYDRIVALMNGILDIVGDNENHPMSGLLDLVGSLVEDYDADHLSIEASEPREILRHLMSMRELRQADLANVIAQGNLSAILAGKRKISAALAGKLAKYFNVSSSLFVAS